MKITRRSMITGITNTLEINVTDAQLADWKGGTLIQDAMPQVSAPDREFVKTGVTGEEWTAIFGTAED